LLGGAGACAGAAAALAPAPPRFAKTVQLQPAGGTVRIRVPGAASYASLTVARDVPVGTLVDTTAGTVKLTSADPQPYRFQSGEFFRGIFEIQQNRTQGGLVNLVLHDSLTQSSACGAVSAHGAAVSKRILGLLRGKAKGHFRTTGRFSAATVLGTNWGVRDRCDGTVTVVRQGVVSVRNFVLHKTVIVRAGQTYLAKAP
jgi:hypothetical protein